MRTATALVGTALAAATLLTACAGESQDLSIPPLVDEPGYPAESTPNPDADLPARSTLQKILRGAGAGNVKVCGWVDPAAAKTVLGAPCPKWVRTLKPADRAKLSAVEVPEAADGDTTDEWIIESPSLVWPQGTPTSPAAASYLMRLSPNGRWTLSL
ncbi:hypothetical protein GCM10027589_54100 [Actinocorallia lasiicapitis]